MGISVPVLKLPDNIFVIYPIYFERYGPFFHFERHGPFFHFAYIATEKSRVSAENIGIKVSALPHS